MKLIQGTTLAQSWLDACEHLLAQPGWVDTTVVLHIKEPARVRRHDKAVAEALDAFLIAHDQYNSHTVAETIFPGYEYVHRGLDGVYKSYPDEIFPRIKDHPQFRHWGTYAHRLLRRTDCNGREYNPLAELIKKMRQKNPVRASYEVGLGFGFDLATYDDDEDRGSRLGGPCLSHLSFKLIGGKVHLTVMYRSHYYIQRAYGNLLGLARLQAFVAEQVGVATGPLVCHSTMAVLEHGKKWGWKKGEVAPLLVTCRGKTRNATPIVDAYG
ncbi:hypothetical protein WME75_04430 [Sorangium sp. So ce1014]|uniref:hypothetical protein n=1 Tax=Sorangium sp. So ce1014 TaxID=3133326 RepID=UPI003F61941C